MTAFPKDVTVQRFATFVAQAEGGCHQWLRTERGQVMVFLREIGRAFVVLLGIGIFWLLAALLVTRGPLVGP